MFLFFSFVVISSNFLINFFHFSSQKCVIFDFSLYLITSLTHKCSETPEYSALKVYFKHVHFSLLSTIILLVMTQYVVSAYYMLGRREREGRFENNGDVWDFRMRSNWKRNPGGVGEIRDWRGKPYKCSSRVWALSWKIWGPIKWF